MSPKRFMLVVKALTDPLVPRTFCCRFTLIDLASCKEEGQGLAGDCGRAFGDEVELRFGPISWERHGRHVQVVDGNNSTPLSRKTSTLRVKSSRFFELALEAFSSCAPWCLFLHLLSLSLRILVGQSFLWPSVSVVSEAKRRLSRWSRLTIPAVEPSTSIACLLSNVSLPLPRL